MALAALHYPHASDTDPPVAAVNAAAVMQCCCEFLRNPPPADVSAAPAEVIVSGGGGPERTGGAECSAEDCSPCGESECRLKPPAAGESAPKDEAMEPKKKESKVRHTLPMYVVQRLCRSNLERFGGRTFCGRIVHTSTLVLYCTYRLLAPLLTNFCRVKLALFSTRL
jgi:hypothetical protein